MIAARHVATTFIVLLVATICYDLARFVAEGFQVPRDEDYVAARAILDEEKLAPGRDALAVLPAWSLRPWRVVGDLRPLGSDDLAGQPLHRYERLFVLQEADATREVAALQERLGPPARIAQAGRVRVLRYDLGQHAISRDFANDLDQAEIFLRQRSTGAVVARCDDVRKGAFHCRGRPSWQRVEHQWLLVSENGQRAIWAHPPPAGEELVLAWEDVLLGDAIVVRAGHTRSGSDRARAPVVVEQWVNGKKIYSVEKTPAFTYQTFDVDTVALSGEKARVELVIYSTSSGNSHFAVDGYVLGP